MILLIDNYDSFVFNLARYLRELGQETVVVRNDAIDTDAIRKMQPEALLISPGPGTPHQAGNLVSIIDQLKRELPMLGVCLGHQAIAVAFGGAVIRAEQPVHGRTSPVQHQETDVFRGLPTPLEATRYHSLIVDAATLPVELQLTATTQEPSGNQTVMGIAHQQLPIFGVQFHPESILTEGGYRLLANFLHLAGCAVTSEIPSVHRQDERYDHFKIPAGQPIHW